MTDIIETMALAILNSDRVAGGWPRVESRDGIPDSDGYARNAIDLVTALTEAGYVILPRVPADAMIAAAAQAIEARSGETEGLDPQGESAVGVTDAPDYIMPPIRVSGPLESEDGE